VVTLKTVAWLTFTGFGLAMNEVTRGAVAASALTVNEELPVMFFPEASVTVTFTR
jgi:hypothetical protein